MIRGRSDDNVYQEEEDSDSSSSLSALEPAPAKEPEVKRNRYITTSKPSTKPPRQSVAAKNPTGGRAGNMGYLRGPFNRPVRKPSAADEAKSEERKTIATAVAEEMAKVSAPLATAAAEIEEIKCDLSPESDAPSSPPKAKRPVQKKARKLVIDKDGNGTLQHIPDVPGIPDLPAARKSSRVRSPVNYSNPEEEEDQEEERLFAFDKVDPGIVSVQMSYVLESLKDLKTIGRNVERSSAAENADLLIVQSMREDLQLRLKDVFSVFQRMHCVREWADQMLMRPDLPYYCAYGIEFILRTRALAYIGLKATIAPNATILKARITQYNRFTEKVSPDWLSLEAKMFQKGVGAMCHSLISAAAVKLICK